MGTPCVRTREARAQLRRWNQVGNVAVSSVVTPAQRGVATGVVPPAREIAACQSGVMLLYNSPVSGNCYKVRLVLAQLGLPYETREVSVVDRSGRAAVLGELNPALRVPTLVLDDGRPLGESNAILWYLAGGSDFVPADRYEQAQALQWMFFEQYSHEPYIAVARFLLAYSGEAEKHAELIASKMPGGYAALDAMERHLGGRTFLVAERYTVADIALYAYTHVAHEGGFDLGGYAAIRAWLGRVAAQPGHVPIDA